jgi:hypothetical protein
MAMVARRPASRVHTQGRVASDRPVVVLESKLVPPPARRGMVARTALLDRLEASGSVPVVAIRGPAGYGKTTLLAQWAALSTHLAAALDRDEPIDQAVFGALASPGASITRTVLPRLGPPWPPGPSRCCSPWTTCTCSATRSAWTRSPG